MLRSVKRFAQASGIVVWGAACLANEGCSDTTAEGLEPVDLTPPIYAPPDSDHDAPLLGGTLAVTRDGQTVVAADPDRDAVFMVDTDTSQVTTVALQPYDRPGRLVEGPDGSVFVIARGKNALLRIDVPTGAIVRRDQLCAAPMGLDYDAAATRVVVACRSGQVLDVDPTSLETLRELRLDDDLRDVVVQGDELVITRFKTTALLVVGPQGTVTARRHEEHLESNSAFRTVAAPQVGGVAMVHQESTNTMLTTPMPSMLPASNNTTPPPVVAYYGSNVNCRQQIVRTAISFVTPTVGWAQVPSVAPEDAVVTTFTLLRGATGPLDLALSSNGNRIALLAMGNNWSKPWRPSLYVLDAEEAPYLSGDEIPDDCGRSTKEVKTMGQPIAVTFDTQGKYVVQSREPATLQFEDGNLVQLSYEPRRNGGLALFYRNNGAGVSCASCHPDGEDDGHTWNFETEGMRRTHSLTGGISGRAPFHWGGELATFDDLIDEVMVRRMSFTTRPQPAYVNDMRYWLDGLPTIDLGPDLAADAVSRGQALFNDPQIGCSGCHNGDKYTDGQLYDVGTGGVFVTPVLIGVGMRAPLMHDGCAATLKARFGSCGGGDQHGVTSSLTDAQVDDLVAFMRSL